MSIFGSAHIFYIIKFDEQFSVGVTQNIDEVVPDKDEAQLVFQKHFDQFDEAKNFENLVKSWDQKKVKELIKGI